MGRGQTGQIGRVGFISEGWLESGIRMGTRSRLVASVVAVDCRSQLAGMGIGTGAGAFALGRSVVIVGMFSRRMPRLPLMVMMSDSSTTSSTMSMSTPKPARAAAAASSTASNGQQTVRSQSDRWTAPVVELTLTDGGVMLRRSRLKQGIVVYESDVRERAKARLTP